MKWLPWRKKNPPQDTAHAAPPPKPSNVAAASPQKEAAASMVGKPNQDFASIVDSRSNDESLEDDGPASFPSDALLSPAYR